MQKKNLIKSGIAVASLVVVSMFGFSTAFGYGGGGVISANCSDVTYGEYGSCFNGIQYRNVLTQTPNSCTLSVKQQLDRSKPCATPATPAVPGVQSAIPANSAKPVIRKEVLGVQKYANGTLLRSRANFKIYVVNGNTLKHIVNLKELSKYAGKATLTVGEDVIATYSQVLGVQKYANGTLVRSKGDAKIFVITNGIKVHIRNLQELRKYAGKAILEIE